MRDRAAIALRRPIPISLDRWKFRVEVFLSGFKFVPDRPAQAGSPAGGMPRETDTRAIRTIPVRRVLIDYEKAGKARSEDGADPIAGSLGVSNH